MKFRQLAEKWLETVYISKSIATYNRYYQTLIWYLYPEFEKFQAHKIKQQQFADFYIKMQTRISKITQRAYSESTINNIHTILYEIMKFGRDKLKQHCILPEYVRIYRNFESKEPVLFFQDKELGKVVLQLYKMRDEKNIFLKLGILIALFHGLRIGEVCGLKWDDIDFENKQFRIRRTASVEWNPIKNESFIYIRKPKTKTSNRTIPINDSIFEILKLLKAKNYSGYLIRNSNNWNIPHMDIPCTDDVLRAKLYRILKRAGVDSRRFHCLRHTFASHAIACGAGPKTVSVVLGHSSVDFTLNVYVHPSEEEKIKCMNFWQLDLKMFFFNQKQEEEDFLPEEIDFH